MYRYFFTYSSLSGEILLEIGSGKVLGVKTTTGVTTVGIANPGDKITETDLVASLQSVVNASVGIFKTSDRSTKVLKLA